MRVLVTGPNGFVGRKAVEMLGSQPDLEVVCAVRKVGSCPGYQEVEIGDLSKKVDWSKALEGVDVVVHLAALTSTGPENNQCERMWRVNVDATLNLAEQSAALGVKRFIFLSSIKVFGEQTQDGKPFTPDDIPSPVDAYGVSKFEAERGLRETSSETGMDVVIIRPPLIYGPGVKGNFKSMATLVEKGIPLPLGAIHNKRSMCALDNLVDLIIACIEKPAAANQIFLVGDGEDLSTTELLRKVAAAKGKSVHLIPIPASILSLCATFIGKKAIASRLLGSLQVDISKACEVLDWKPPLSVEEGLRRCFASGDQS